MFLSFPSVSLTAYSLTPGERDHGVIIVIIIIIIIVIIEADTCNQRLSS
jgi:hypothetical protein